MSRRRAVAAAVGLSLTCSLAACSAIIGTRDLTLEASDSGTTQGPITTEDAQGASGDSSVQGDTSTSERNDSSFSDSAPIERDDGSRLGPDSSSADSSLPGMDSGSSDDTGTSTGADSGMNADTGGGAVDDAGVCSPADLLTDALNCGTCMHNCLGGACSGGRCQAFAIVPAQNEAHGIAQDDAGIYWTTSGSLKVLKANKDGGSVTTLTTLKSPMEPWDIAIDDSNVYWTDTEVDVGSVQTCPKTGGDGGFTLVTTKSLGSASGLAVDQANVYWNENDNDTVGRAPKSGVRGVPEYLATWLSGGYEIALDDASVLFTTPDTVGAVSKTGPVVGDPNDTLDASVSVFYENDNAGPYGVATDGINVYWVVYDDNGRVEYAPRNSPGTTPTVLAAGETLPLMIALDDDNVYWTANGVADEDDNYTQGYLATCPKAGCPSGGPVVLASGLSQPYGIAVDDTAIYFTVFGISDNDGSVMKIAK